MERVNITVPAKYGTCTLSLLLPFQFPVDIMQILWSEKSSEIAFCYLRMIFLALFLCDKKYIVESIVRSKVYSVFISMFLGQYYQPTYIQYQFYILKHGIYAYSTSVVLVLFSKLCSFLNSGLLEHNRNIHFLHYVYSLAHKLGRERGQCCVVEWLCLCYDHDWGICVAISTDVMDTILIIYRYVVSELLLSIEILSIYITQFKYKNF